uniref:Migration and invasion inhibitory protein n=1 Tax=Pipistrellus kuhlii TaxID=59472 RepID=A0A7J7T1F9_PIPKU|nr:migration and invasion inhibitory protein [Pipistrellus kuhlii]
MPGTVETRDLAQLRQLNLELLRQLWARQDAMRRSVAKAASESNADASSSYDSEMSLSQKMPSAAQRTSSPWDASEGDSCDMSSLGGTGSGVTSLPPAKEPLRPCGAPLLATPDSDDSERSTEPEAWALRSLHGQQRKLPKLSVTFNKESPVPERSWRLRPYLGYDWIAGSLDNRSPISSKPEAFFSELQAFRETNKEECIHREPEPQLPGRRESDSSLEDHECVYCYRVNRRLFLVPSDPGAPCRLCRTPRDQRGPKTLADPAQVRTVCWAGIFSLRSPRTAPAPRAWTSGPVSPPRPSTSRGAPARHTRPSQRGSRPPPRSGPNPRRPSPARAPWRTSPPASSLGQERRPQPEVDSGLALPGGAGGWAQACLPPGLRRGDGGRSGRCVRCVWK